MNKGMLAVGIILLAAMAFAVINVVQSYSSGNELDYYLLKETTEASMTDAVDIGYYRLSGEIRMDKEKFVESFVRRFSESVNTRRDYKIRIYDINETPPKVTVKVDSTSPATFNSESVPISNEISAILETTYQSNKLIQQLIREGKLDYSNVKRK